MSASSRPQIVSSRRFIPSRWFRWFRNHRSARPMVLLRSKCRLEQREDVKGPIKAEMKLSRVFIKRSLASCGKVIRHRFGSTSNPMMVRLQEKNLLVRIIILVREQNRFCAHAPLPIARARRWSPTSAAQLLNQNIRHDRHSVCLRK